MRMPLTLLLTIAIVSPCRADCVPEKMVKVVFREVTPGIDRGSFAAKPKTLYRLGSKYGRTEEALDSALKIHGLIIVDEPDVWMINLVTRTGQHIVDTGEPYHFHAPIVGGPDDPEVYYVQSPEESRELSLLPESYILVASGGMCRRR